MANETTGPPPTAQSEGSPKSGRILWWVVGSTLAGFGVVGVILYYGYMTRPGWVGVADKKFWDYLDLLFVPVAIALGVALINWMQSERARRDEEAQQRRESELQDQRAQDNALQAYLDQLTLLLVTKQDQGLIRMKVDEEVRQVVQARSEPLLRSLNPTRRFSLILFLSGMGLIERDRSLVSLAGADLRGVDGRGAPLEAVDLGRADLREADLRETDLRRSNLEEANLSGAMLMRANLQGANLYNANFQEVNLQEANLQGAFLQEANLEGADLQGANLQGANLTQARLQGAFLQAANLPGASLQEANLQGAFLQEANLEGADLQDAEVTDEQLAATWSLQGATMPNSQKYEDWLKEREKRQQDE